MAKISKANTTCGKTNRELNDARLKKNDEFYTSLIDIEKELFAYNSYFRGATILCNCDNPAWSNFWHFFATNFVQFGLRRLISIHYVEGGISCKTEMFEEDGDIRINETAMQGDGDFRSNECIEVLKQSDIVVTNPPFSLFRPYIQQLIEHSKLFLIMGTINAVTYKDVFPLIRNNKIWLGHSISSGDREFRVPNEYLLETSVSRMDLEGNKYIRVKGIRWFTNMDHGKRNHHLALKRAYNPLYYKKHNNYDAIEVSRTEDIPSNYAGAMAVPITFLDKYSQSQFEILNSNDIKTNDRIPMRSHGLIKGGDGLVDGKRTYARIVIRSRLPVSTSYLPEGR